LRYFQNFQNLGYTSLEAEQELGKNNFHANIKRIKEIYN